MIFAVDMARNLVFMESLLLRVDDPNDGKVCETHWQLCQMIARISQCMMLLVLEQMTRFSPEYLMRLVLQRRWFLVIQSVRLSSVSL